MKQISVRTALAMLAILAVTLAVFRDQLRESLGLGPELPLRSITSESQLEDAIGADGAVIFIDADWSVPTKVALEKVVEFIRERRKRDQRVGVSFYLLDITGDDHGRLESYVSRWLTSDARLAELRGSGSGELVWIKDGRIVGVSSGFRMTPDEIAGKIRGLYGRPR